MSLIRVSPHQLDALIAADAACRPECNGCSIEAITPTHADLAGCNWQPPVIEGPTCIECLQALKPTLDAYRQQYRLIPELDVGTVFVSPWATDT